MRVLVTGGGGFIGSHLARFLYLQGNYVRAVDIKFDDYIQEKYCAEKLQLDLRPWENCLTATKDVDKVYNLAANMRGIGFITTQGAEVMHDNVLINAQMRALSAPQGVRGRNADITLARNVLGWEPEVSLEKALAKTYRWIAEQCATDKSSALQ